MSHVRYGPVEEPAAWAVDLVIRALNDDRPLARGHAAWALGQVGGSFASEALSSRLEVGEDDWVREEREMALSESI